MQSLVTSKRVESIDLLRGLVMIIMALDHTRDFFHREALTDDPLNLGTTTPFLYFTRWITHFCAPAFVFLAGVSAWLQGRKKSRKELSFFLITRGLWLVLIELTVVSFGITADIHFGMLILQTIWAIGISMIFLGLAIWLPFRVILITGLLIVFGHNSLDFVEKDHKGPFPAWWNLLHVPGMIPISSDHLVGVFYPFLSWAGLMLLGYCCGKIFSDVEPVQRRKILLYMGFGLLILFVVLRAINVYGDPDHWSYQRNGLYTFLSFMKVRKYPPSLLYMSVTIGIALIFLGLVKNTGSRISKIISVYGRVPFFYYILHFYLLHIIAAIVFLSRGHTLAEGLRDMPGVVEKFEIPGEGYSLWVVYAIWISVVIALYPLCKWYDAYKTTHREKRWLSYL
jgi:uncharacterized membrane protein